MQLPYATCRLNFRRLWLVFVAIGVGVFAAGSGSLVDGCDSDAFCDANTWLAIGVMVALSLPVAFVVMIAGLLLLRGRRGVRRQAVAAAAACSLAAALLVSTPVAVGWDDGCNAHGALVPLAAYPAVLMSPEAFPRAYVDIQTLMLCHDRPPEID